MAELPAEEVARITRDIRKAIRDRHEYVYITVNRLDARALVRHIAAVEKRAVPTTPPTPPPLHRRRSDGQRNRQSNPRKESEMSTYLIRFGSMNIGKFEADSEDAAVALFLDQCCFESIQGAAREYGVDPKDIEIIDIDNDPRFVRV